MSNVILELKSKVWKEFDLKDIFPKIQRGKRLKKANHLKGKIPYVSSTALSNGVDGYIGNTDGTRKFYNCLSLANSGSVGSCFYQPFEFVASDHVTKLENSEFNKYIYLFLSSVVSRISEKYSFNREINDTRIKKEKILLPVNEKDEPDYEFMEQFMKSKEIKFLTKYKNHISLKINEIDGGVIPVSRIKWGAFFIEHVTEIMSGRDIYTSERIKGDTPYVSSTSNNNGIGDFVGNNNSTKERGCLSVNRNGSVGYSFFHPYDALFSNDCRKLRLLKYNKYIGIFISQQITNQRGKYGYGYKMGTARLKRQKIMLPITQDNEPDYVYMENCIKQLEQKKIQNYLELKLSVSNEMGNH